MKRIQTYSAMKLAGIARGIHKEIINTNGCIPIGSYDLEIMFSRFYAAIVPEIKKNLDETIKE